MCNNNKSCIHSQRNYVNSFNRATEECRKRSAQLAFIPPNMDDAIEHHFKNNNDGGTAFPKFINAL